MTGFETRIIRRKILSGLINEYSNSHSPTEVFEPHRLGPMQGLTDLASSAPSDRPRPLPRETNRRRVATTVGRPRPASTREHRWRVHPQLSNPEELWHPTAIRPAAS